MILEVDEAALFFVEFKREFPAGSAIEHQLRVKLIYYDFLEHVVIELSELHLAKDQPHAIELNKAFAAMSDASALDLSLFELDEELALASLCQVGGLMLSFGCEGDWR